MAIPSFVDRVKLTVQAGNGGHGCTSIHREKFVPLGGPDGGNGGTGGSIIFRVDDSLSTLVEFHRQSVRKAVNGQPGKGDHHDGANGDDVVLAVPSGTVVTDAETGEVLADLTEPGAEYVAAAGGKGGLGNAALASAARKAPGFALLGYEDDLPKQHAVGSRRLSHGEFQVAGLLPDCGGQGDRRFFKSAFGQAFVLDHRHLLPLLFVRTRVDRDARDLEVIRPLVRQHMSFVDELLGAEAGHDVDIAVVLNALGRGTLPFAVAEEGWSWGGVLMRRRGLAVCFIRERHRIAQGRSRARLGKHNPGQGRRWFLAPLQPKAIGSADVLAQVGPGSGQEHGGPVLGRRNRRRHGARGAAYNENVNIVQDRDPPRRLHDDIAGLGRPRAFRVRRES